MGFFSNKKQELTDDAVYVSEHLKGDNLPFLWLIAIGVAVYCFGLFLQFLGYNKDHQILKYNYPQVGPAIRELGKIGISTTIFTFLLTSKKFVNFFKKTLIEIIYADEFLKRRHDAEDIWYKVTNSLTKKKFPSINDNIIKRIKSDYLPVNSKYYYKDFGIEIDMELHECGDDFVVLYECVKTVIISESKERIEIDINCNLPKVNSDIHTNVECLDLNINNKSIEAQETKFDESEMVKRRFRYAIEGSREYHIHYKIKKIYNIKQNPYRHHNALSLYDNFSLSVNYPNSINIEFIKIGVLDDWVIDKDHSIRDYSKLRATYNGIIFKNQGFMLLYAKK